jgi:hypothetical protein
LEWWKTGMLEYWVKVLWIDNLMEEPVLIKNSKEWLISFEKTIFHHSTIPIFRGRVK